MFRKVYVRSVFFPSLGYSLVRNKLDPANWRRFDKIEDNLYLSMLPLWFDKEELKEQFDAIISMNKSWELFMSPDFAKHFEHLHLPTQDYNVEVKEADVENGVNFIKQMLAQNKKCLVHCKAGRGRSVVIVACYLMDTRGYTPERALKEIHRCRPQVPTLLGSNQMVSLYKYYDKLQAKQRELSDIAI
jgi:predicted protein tyrosine phosphatase